MSLFNSKPYPQNLIISIKNIKISNFPLLAAHIKGVIPVGPA